MVEVVEVVVVVEVTTQTLLERSRRNGHVDAVGVGIDASILGAEISVTTVTGAQLLSFMASQVAPLRMNTPAELTTFIRLVLESTATLLGNEPTKAVAIGVQLLWVKRSQVAPSIIDTVSE